MNELQVEDVSADDPVIARLRAALDEVTAESDGLVAVEAPRPKVSAGRWMAVAAAVVLIAGAVAAIAINRKNAPEVATVSTDVATTSATEPVLIRSESPWFRLVAADLVPGERTNVQCCVKVQAVAMAWSNGDKYLTLVTFSKATTTEVAPAGESTLLETDSEFLEFRSVGLSADERAALAGQVVPGSGLPYLLPVEGWEMVAFGQSSDDGGLLQTYTPLNNDPLSSYLPFIEMRVGGYRGELSMLAMFPEPQPVTVAGYDGWKVTESDGTVSVFWEADNGYWATLRIDAQLADRADALIAGVIRVPESEANRPTVETIPVPIEADPLSIGDVLTGELRSVASGGPVVFVFVSPSCVPCNDAVQELVAKGRADESQVPQIALVIAEPLDEVELNSWLQEIGWTGIVIRDENNISGTQFAIEAVPSYVFTSVDSEGTILDLISGLFTSDTLAELGVD